MNKLQEVSAPTADFDPIADYAINERGVVLRYVNQEASELEDAQQAGFDLAHEALTRVRIGLRELGFEDHTAPVLRSFGYAAMELSEDWASDYES